MGINIEGTDVVFVIFHILGSLMSSLGLPGGSVVKNAPANAGDAGLIPGSGRSPGGGNGNPLQYSCLENPMDREGWWATVHAVTKSWTWLNTHTQACMQTHRIMSVFLFLLIKGFLLLTWEIYKVLTFGDMSSLNSQRDHSSTVFKVTLKK